MSNDLLKYHFRDDHGHPLENCKEYIALLAVARAARELRDHRRMMSGAVNGAYDYGKLYKL